MKPMFDANNKLVGQFSTQDCNKLAGAAEVLTLAATIDRSMLSLAAQLSDLAAQGKVEMPDPEATDGRPEES